MQLDRAKSTQAETDKTGDRTCQDGFNPWALSSALRVARLDGECWQRPGSTAYRDSTIQGLSCLSWDTLRCEKRAQPSQIAGAEGPANAGEACISKPSHWPDKVSFCSFVWCFGDAAALDASLIQASHSNDGAEPILRKRGGQRPGLEPSRTRCGTSSDGATHDFVSRPSAFRFGLFRIA